jgi:hypothetical protein
VQRKFNVVRKGRKGRKPLFPAIRRDRRGL